MIASRRHCRLKSLNIGELFADFLRPRAALKFFYNKRAEPDGLGQRGAGHSGIKI